MADLPLTDLAALNDYSRQFADVLFAKYPQWRGLAVYNPDEGTLLVEVPPDLPERPKLRVFTDDDEVTVEFDLWHRHHDWDEESRETAWQDALDFVADLLAERMSVQVWMEGERWRGSTLVEAGDTWSRYPEGWDASGLTHTYRRSFQGTFDGERTLSG